MNPIIAFNVISKQFSKHGSEILKLEFDINASASATVYVQVHDFPQPADLAAGLTVPAAGSVPIKSWPAPAGATNGYKEFKRGDLAFTYGCFVCVSTTQATLTIGTSNNKFDSVAAELISADIVGTEVNSQGQAKQQVWTETTGATTEHLLVRAAVTNLEATVCYVMLFARNTPILADIPIQQWAIAATGDGGGLDTVFLSFGGVGYNSLDGITVTEVQIPSATPIKTGCTLAVSTTAAKYTPQVGSKSNFYAEYR